MGSSPPPLNPCNIVYVLPCLGHQRQRSCLDFGAESSLHLFPVLVCVVFALLMKFGETEMFGYFMFSGAGWEGRDGREGVRSRLGEILELTGVERGAWDNLVD